MDYAVCIGCGACVAACPNGSAMLFAGAKVAHLAELPQGQPERYERVVAMVKQHDAEGFGACTNHGECAAVCPVDNCCISDPAYPEATDVLLEKARTLNPDKTIDPAKVWSGVRN